MESTEENRFVSYIHNTFKEDEVDILKLTVKNWPDRLVLIKNSKPVFFEMKWGSGAPSVGQHRKARVLESMGFTVHFPYTSEEAIAMLHKELMRVKLDRIAHDSI